MVFSSPIFLWVFLPITLFAYFIVGNRLKNYVLLLANIIFYAWGEPKFVFFIFISIIANYFIGLWVEKENEQKKRKNALIAGIIFNLSFLLFFKYFNFIIQNVNVLNDIFGIANVRFPKIFLPLGISFYTFQAMSYIIDIYRSEIKAQKNIFILAMYKTLFPQLIAGPIIRYKDIENQMENRKTDYGRISYGIQRFITGLGKKVLIANTVAALCDEIFLMNAGDLSLGLTWLGVLCYTLQIYYDFSGYSDMAIGLGSIFGFTFLENFNYPYISKSIKEFWRRWHISLSSWFRDYLYIPLGGNRVSRLRSLNNLLIVFFLCGLWHGASWNFVAWGVFHGFFLVLERTGFGKLIDKLWNPFKHIYTLLMVMIGWVLFRTETLGVAVHYIKTMVGFGKLTSAQYPVIDFLDKGTVLAIIIGIVLATPIAVKIKAEVVNITVKLENKIHASIVMSTLKICYIGAIFSILILCMMSLASGTYNPFIYFRF